MPAADRQQQRQWREALTRLTRLAQRQPDARDWLEDMLRRNMPAILAPALEVAAETGAPLPEVLARALAADASWQAHETVARAVPMDATVLQDLAIASLRALLDQDTGPVGEPTGEVPAVRRPALRAALATRLAAAGRLDEARLAAEQALAGIPDDPSSQARGVDAYDVLAQCQLAAGDALGAVDSARRALTLRQSIDDPFRGQADGEWRLALALLAAGRPEEACRTLVSAVSRLRGLLAGARDVRFALEDQLAAGAKELHLAVTMGWNPNGFDEVVIDQGFRVDFLVGRFHGCLADLLKAIEEHEPRLSEGTVTAVKAELAAARPLLRRGVDDTVLRLRILRLLGRRLSTGSASLIPAISADEFDAMADDALAAGDRHLAAFVRMTQADYLRQQEPVDRRALANALNDLSRLIAGADAVTVMREAVEAASGDDPVSHALMLHNLARRLSENGQPAEGFEASSQAVCLLSEAFATRPGIPPLAMAALFETLVQRGQESGSEIELHPNVVTAAEKMLNDAGRATGADLSRQVSATCGLFDSAMRQGDTATAQRLANAVCRLATLRPDDEAIQLARALLASQLLWAAIGEEARDRARQWLAEVAASTGNAPDLDALAVELGKCTADLIGAYRQAGDVETAAQLARESRAALLSEPYLAARRRDLGGDQADYVHAVTRLAEQHPSAPPGLSRTTSAYS
jgi:hypothetical protein